MTIWNREARQGARTLWVGYGGYAVLALSLAAAGGFAAMHANAFSAVVTVATVTLAIGFFVLPGVRALAEAAGPWGLAVPHVWRITAGLAFLHAGQTGALPPLFATLAGWGDVLAGTLAMAVAAWPGSRRLLVAFHWIVLADFLVAVGTGITLTQIDPASMHAITLLPLAFIPLVGVPISGASHVWALVLLREGRDYRQSFRTLRNAR